MGQCPQLGRLIKSKLALPQEPSPGCAHGCRVALQDPSPSGDLFGAFVANANKVYGIKIPPNTSDGVVGGKEGTYLPTNTEMDVINIKGLTLQSEVQSIDLVDITGGVLIGGVDSYGTAVIERLNSDWHQDPDIETKCTQTLCRSPSGEAGWAGIRFSSTEPAECAIARSYLREVTLYSDSKIKRTFRFPHQPTAVGLGENWGAPMLVANGHEVWALDQRMHEKGGCVARMLAAHSGSQVYCVSRSHSSPSVIGVGTSERCVTIWEPRKWIQMCRWSGCLKEAVTGVAFSRISPNYSYVTGSNFSAQSLLLQDLQLSLAADYLEGVAPGFIVETSFFVCLVYDSSACEQYIIASLLRGPTMLTGMDPACICGIWEQGMLGKGKRKQITGGPEKPPSFQGDARWLSVTDCKSGDHLAGFTESGSFFVASYYVRELTA